MTSNTDWLGAGPTDMRAPLIGRDSEMAMLDQALAQVVALKQMRVVTLLGAAGIGKTRLVYEFLGRMRKGPAAVVRTFRGAATGAGHAYSLFSRLLRARFGLVEGMSEAESRQTIRKEVSEVLADRQVDDVVYFIGQMLGLTFEGSFLAKAISDDPREAQVLRSMAFRSFLTADAARGPVCLVFEDLHEASDESLDLLEFLLENLQGPVLALCCARHELETRRDGWRKLRTGGVADRPSGDKPIADRPSDGGQSAHRVLELAPLSLPQAAQVVTSLLSPCGDPPQQLIDAACEMAGGNPSLLEQMVRIYRDTGVLEEEDLFAETTVWKVHLDKLATVQLPMTVDEAVQARIAMLSPEYRKVLERAAAIGSVFWLGALVVLGRIDGDAPEYWRIVDDVDVRGTQKILRELADKDYILKLPDSTFAGDEEYVFKHNLERERLARLTSASNAKQYHRAVAGWLERQPHAKADEEYAAMLGFHREAAGALRGAAMMYLEAGDIARSRYSPAKAVEYYEKGIQLLDDDEPVRRMNAHHDLGDVLQQLGRNDEAIGSFREMLTLAYRFSYMGKGGAAHNRIGRLYREAGTLDQAVVHLGTGLALFEACEDERGVASSLDDIGKLYWLRGDYHVALEHLERALSMRKRIGDPRSIALSLNNVGLVLQDSGAPPEALDVLRQALEIRKEIGDLVGVVLTLNNIGTVKRGLGHAQEAFSTFQQALEIAQDIGDRGKAAMTMTNMGNVLVEMGQHKEAVAILEEAVNGCDELNLRIGKAEALRGLGQAHMAAGDIVKARSSISKAVDIFVLSKNKVQLASALRALGEITAAGGWGEKHASKGRDYFKRSIAIFEQVGNELELARSLKSYAAFLKEQEQREAEVGQQKNVQQIEIKQQAQGDLEGWEQIEKRAQRILEKLGLGGNVETWDD